MKFNKLIPELMVKNIEKSKEFYSKILGFKIEYERKEDKFVFLSFQGSQIMLQEDNKVWETGKLEYPYGRGINFQIEVKDIKQILKRLKIANITVKIEPEKNWYKVGKKLMGNEEFLVIDPDGYLLRFFRNLGVQKVK